MCPHCTGLHNINFLTQQEQCVLHCALNKTTADKNSQCLQTSRAFQFQHHKYVITQQIREDSSPPPNTHTLLKIVSISFQSTNQCWLAEQISVFMLGSSSLV